MSTLPVLRTTLRKRREGDSCSCLMLQKNY